MDREKVIEGLEKVWDAFNHMEHEMYADYVFDAVALLKEQEETELCDRMRNCKNCANRYELWKWDYSQSGVPKKKMDGFICSAFASEGIMIWQVGNDGNGQCECWWKRESKR